MIRSIQLLRAIAALLVVWFHAQGVVSNTTNHFTFTNIGASGVDLFFVISGFIMVFVSYDRFGKEKYPINFLKSRIKRIVPNYYLFTTISVGILIFLPSLYSNLEFSLKQTILSYLFILSTNNVGEIGTVVGVGWTLAFEAFFYFLFAIMLNFKRKYLIPCLSVVFMAGYLSGVFFVVPFAWTIVVTNPLVFEFLIGCCIGMIYKQGRFVGKTASMLLILVGVSWIYYTGSAGMLSRALDYNRVIAFGIPAGLIVAGAIFIEKLVVLKIPKILLIIGDSSYSLYLIHQYTVKALGIWLIPILAKANVSTTLIVFLTLIIAIFTGFLCYYFFERPVTRLIAKHSAKRLMQRNSENSVQYLS